MRDARRKILTTSAVTAAIAIALTMWVAAAAVPAKPRANPPAGKPPADSAASFGIPAAVHYIDHDKVAATMVKGGAIVSDPGLTILANRRGAGQVEYHDHTSHVFIMVEGEATLITGGTMIDAKRTAADQMVATGIDGGEVHHMTKGDVITIPAKTPHWWKDVSTSTVAYYAVNIESK